MTTGPFRRCRHPLYFFASVFLLADPRMTAARSLVAGCAVAYFLIGSWFEERRLLDQFGDPYRRYRDATPRFVPRLFAKSKGG